MYTVCPKCALTLVVTAADLRVAQGYVRCGRCSSVFNALAQLTDERAARGAEPPPAAAEQEEESEPQGAEPASAEPAAPPPAKAPAASARPPERSSTPPPPSPPEEEAISEDALEFNPEKTDAASVFVAAPPNPEWTAATGSFKALVAANQEAIAPHPQPADLDLDIELDAALLSNIVESQPPPKPTPAAPRPPAPQAPAGDVAVMAVRAALATEPQVGPLPKVLADDVFAPVERGAAPTSRLGARLWGAGAVLLVVVLVAQLINHQRDALATDPRFAGPITRLYASLGVPLTPRWDLHAYDVRQLGATVAPGSTTGTGTITVRASIRNAGPKPQPLPLLRVTLQDRFGNRLASRDVQPGDYLPRNLQPVALMPVDQRIDAELAFVDPGTSAVGFELDACLAVRGGVACANDVSTH
jgi:predicted Zn finger-like uncharacterized protein